MSDERALPPEDPDTFLSGSESADDDADPSHGSQALLPSDFEEPAEFTGQSGE